MSKRVDGYKITNAEGRDGRAWRGMYESPEDAAHSIAVQMGWEEPYVSEPFQDVDDDGRGIRSWCVYPSQEALEEGAFAIDTRSPRIVLTDVKILRACTDLHGDMIGFLDGALIAHFPGVAARMRAGLAAIGWTFAFGEECRAKYNAIMKATNFTGVVVPDGKCQRCGGAGRISAYSHVSGGECFDCGGSGLAADCEVA